MTAAELRQRFLASSAGRWYAGREPNEQWVILALAAAIGVVFFWLALWQPVSDWRELAHNRYRNAQATFDWMRANERRARAVATSEQADTGQRSLLPVITRSAQSQGIEVNRVQPESSGVVGVSIQGQPFNDVIRWLHQLQENNGVTIARLAVDAEERPGRVNAQLRLR